MLFHYNSRQKLQEDANFLLLVLCHYNAKHCRIISETETHKFYMCFVRIFITQFTNAPTSYNIEVPSVWGRFR